MNREQRPKIISSNRDDILPSLTTPSTSLRSQSTSGPSSSRGKAPRPNSTPQLRIAPSSSPTPPTTYPPLSDDAPDSPNSFRTPDSPLSPGLPSPASSSSAISSNQLSPTSSSRLQDQSNPNLNKPLPVPPPASRRPSGYGHACLPPPPPAYAAFDPHALLFTIAFPYVFASSVDADASPYSSSTFTPRYQLSTSQTRAGRPHQLALRRLTRSESRRVALTMTDTLGPPAAPEVHIPFDVDLTLYTATYYSPRAAVPEMHGCKASTVAGRLQPSGSFPPASASGLRAGLGRKKSSSRGSKSKGRGPSWDLCRLTRERDGGDGDIGGAGGLALGHKEVGTKWGYKDKDAWRKEVVFAVTEKETDTRGGVAAGGEVKDEEEEKQEEGLVRRFRRKGSLGLSLRRGFGTARSNEECDWAREHRRNGKGEHVNEACSRTHHRIFEWRAGTVSLSSPTPNAPHPTLIHPTELLATSGSTKSTRTHPFTAPIHAATAPAPTLHRRSSTTAMALRRVASRVSLRTAPSCSTLSTAPTFASSSPSTVSGSRTAPRGAAQKTTGAAGEVLRVREKTRRWLRLEKPLERRALDALVAAWVAGVWMEGEGALE